MKILLLHPEDELPLSEASSHWDLVVDLARAPASTYVNWARVTGARVISLYDFSQEVEDSRAIRDLLRSGMGVMVDRQGIDWWDVLSLMIAPDLHRMMLMHRLANEIPGMHDVYASRAGVESAALQFFLGARVKNREGVVLRFSHRVRHYWDVTGTLGTQQLLQVIQDKFDNRHRIRRWMARRHPRSNRPAVLLPSAYVNVSRTAVSYAKLLPEEPFLLIHARNSGRLKFLPSNVSQAPLDPYFVTSEEREMPVLLDLWHDLHARLIAGGEEYTAAAEAGVLARIPGLLRWGVAVRDAWNQVFAAQSIRACLSADDNNPYSRIPLILAKHRGMPALACHHGALDYRMAMKISDADIYLAKSGMEQDYLIRLCDVPPERIVMGAPTGAQPIGPRPANISDRPWLVYFSEPYGAQGWRNREVYRDLLPRLAHLAQISERKLVFKLHPFEDVRGHRRLLRAFLPPDQVQRVDLFAGPITEELWQNTAIALTVQSTVSLDCAARRIPVFLCAWLRAPEGSFVQQFEKFGIGRVLNSPEEIADIPRLLQEGGHTPLSENATWKGIDPSDLQNLLAGHSKPPVGAEELA
jgi:hypothetical protein